MVRILAVDWKTGQVTSRWPAPDDSRAWNTSLSWATVLDDGDFLLGGFFSIKRVNVGDGKWQISGASLSLIAKIWGQAD